MVAPNTKVFPVMTYIPRVFDVEKIKNFFVRRQPLTVICMQKIEKSRLAIKELLKPKSQHQTDRYAERHTWVKKKHFFELLGTQKVQMRQKPQDKLFFNNTSCE